MSGSSLVVEHKRRRQAALAAAEALLSGDLEPAGDLLAVWRFAEDEDLLARMLADLRDHPPHPPSRQRSVLLAAALPDSEATDGPLWLSREALLRADLDEVEDSPLTRVAWGLEELRSIGEGIESRQRQAWRQLTFAPDPAEDARIRRLWEGWFSGDPWSIQAEWDALFLPIAHRAFSVMMDSRGLPRSRQDYILADVDDSAMMMMLGSKDTPRGWQELAVRVLESAPPSPITALTGLLDTRGCLSAALCAVSRGYGPRSARVLYPSISNPVQAARRLATACQEDPAALDTALDLHVACRLLERWSDSASHADIARDWEVVKQNRGRARARLRALLSAGAPAPLREPLLSLDALADRTRYAIRRYCRDWAWIQLSRHFPFHSHPIDAVCGQAEAAAFTDSDRDAMRTWVMLVILKGRLGHLQRWIHSGGTGDRDATWGRLQKDLPDRLRNQNSSGRMSRGLPRLRAELAELFPVFLDEHLPHLETIAALPQNRALSERLNAVLDASRWHPDIPRPGGRYHKRYQSHAAEALAQLRPPGGSP